LPDEDCCAIDPPKALRAAKRKTGIDMPEQLTPNPTNHGKRGRQKSLHCYTYPQLLFNETATSPGSHFNQQGGSIFNQRGHPINNSIGTPISVPALLEK
jgi:hypothetical protein